MSIAQWRATSPTCRSCGQLHPAGDPHVYNYSQEVDEDLTCHICLQPLVSPTDTKCGHTFCRACITSYLRIQQICPIDRQPLTTYDCQPASLMVRRLLDKLEVECPNFAMCHSRIQRYELEAHLNNRCPGAIFTCLQACFDCPFQGNWQQLQIHNKDCPFLERHTAASVDAAKVPIVESDITKIEIQRTSSVLGLSIVGGYDSPLKCIIVQEIHPGSVVAKDGRLQPGDQLIEVNGKDLTHCPHNYVVNILKTSSPTLQLSVYRERVDHAFGDHRPEVLGSGDVIRVGLDKLEGRSLGIKLAEKRHQQGVFISEVVEGSITAQDGRLQPGDCILEINSHDVTRSKIQEASLLIQISSRHIEFVAWRSSGGGNVYSGMIGSPSGNPPSPVHSQNCEVDDAACSNQDSMMMTSSPPPTSWSLPTADPCLSLPPPPLPRKPQQLTPTASPICAAPPETALQMYRRNARNPNQMNSKYFTVAKGPSESLGIRVAGGLESQQGNTPVYIQNIAPQGCLGRNKLLKKGDVLLSVNGTSLLGISHAEAVSALKVAAGTTSLTLGIVEGPETSSGPDMFTPTWMYWHKLPRSLHLTKTVTLRRSSSESLGFSLVGGKDSFQSSQTFHVLLVVRDSIAAKEGKLRCGDQILAVNGHRLDGLRHAEAVNLLKQTRSKVLLEILSWPGTVV